MRAYLVAFGLTTLMLGLPLFFAGAVGIGCTVTVDGGVTNSSNCGGAQSLELGGGILVLAAVVFFAGSLVPSSESRYK
jgi:hypothetical protein